ncbi:MAG: galactokinase [Ruminococcaceae bacterium]|nr:galactokinase [Oscillospiraceae bacterium]
MKAPELIQTILSGGLDAPLAALYADPAVQRERYIAAIEEFCRIYGADRELRLFSAPGRTEVGGNHTDHNHGRVLAAAVNLDVIAVVAPWEDDTVRIQSAGFPEDVVSLSCLTPQPEEKNTSAALIRGVAAGFVQRGYRLGGFRAYTTSSVLKGSGLSSSAAFEVLLSAIFNGLFCGDALSAVERAKISQYAENRFFGKPSGLMDQTASAVGGFITIDFADPAKPVIEQVDFDFAASGYALCITDTRADHSDLTDEYAAIRTEMQQVAGLFGEEFLRPVSREALLDRIPEAREQFGDRAVLRALHFINDNQRVADQAAALRSGNTGEFLRLVSESGRSSFMYLQNVHASGATVHQEVSLALALSEELLAGKGAFRIHGGGFAGTIQAFVPTGLVEHYRTGMEAVFGPGSCYILSVRAAGGCEVK